MSRAVRLGRGTAGFLCPESANSMAVSLTWLCSPVEVESVLLLEKTPRLPPFTAAVPFF